MRWSGAGVWAFRRLADHTWFAVGAVVALVPMVVHNMLVTLKMLLWERSLPIGIRAPWEIWPNLRDGARALGTLVGCDLGEWVSVLLGQGVAAPFAAWSGLARGHGWDSPALVAAVAALVASVAWRDRQAWRRFWRLRRDAPTPPTPARPGGERPPHPAHPGSAGGDRAVVGLLGGRADEPLGGPGPRVADPNGVDGRQPHCGPRCGVRVPAPLAPAPRPLRRAIRRGESGGVRRRSRLSLAFGGRVRAGRRARAWGWRCAKSPRSTPAERDTPGRSGGSRSGRSMAAGRNRR